METNKGAKGINKGKRLNLEQVERSVASEEGNAASYT